MNKGLLLGIIISFSLFGCLKAKRTPFDLNTPSGSVIARALILANILQVRYPDSQYKLATNSQVSIVPSALGIISSCSTSPTLPTGLSISSNCSITGTPTTEQTVKEYKVTVKNANNNELTINLSIEVKTFIITYSASSYVFTIGTPITVVTPTTSLTPSSISISPSLPTGLSFDTATGKISGTPVLFSRENSDTVTATNSTVSDSFTFTVAATSAPIAEPWGTFSDLGNGLVQLDGTAGTFGSKTYTAQTLYYMKCSQGQTWNSTTNGCDGGAGTFQFCSTGDNNCNGGNPANDLGVGGFSGGSTSTAYNTCNSIGSLGGRTAFRVPTKNELRLLIKCTAVILPNDVATCGGAPSPSINNLFPNTTPNYYWSSTVSNTSGAMRFNFNAGGVDAQCCQVKENARLYDTN